MSVFGTHIIISLFGESHGTHIGATIHHLPANVEINQPQIEGALSRRRPAKAHASARREKDSFSIVSGMRDSRTTGAPLTILIANEDTDSSVYDTHIPRPSHADYAAYKKYHGAHDPRGGGHFSGRLTAPLVAIGDIARQLLVSRNITVLTHVRRIGDIEGPSMAQLAGAGDFAETLGKSAFPASNDMWRKRYEDRIQTAHEKGDSVGGETETVIFGVTAGLGEPFFDGFESILSHLLFSIPGVKGVEFGKGFALAQKNGSDANDPIRVNTAGDIVFAKNDMGGILGGISSGQTIYFNTAFKPSPTIHIPQKTINLHTSENILHTFTGRHDACIVPRAAHVVSALTYYAILELIVRNEGCTWTPSNN